MRRVQEAREARERKVAEERERKMREERIKEGKRNLISAKKNEEIRQQALRKQVSRVCCFERAFGQHNPLALLCIRIFRIKNLLLINLLLRITIKWGSTFYETSDQVVFQIK